MKKTIALIALTLTLALLFCACSKTPKDPSAETGEETTAVSGVSGIVSGFLTQNVRVSGSVGQWENDFRVRLFSSYKQYKNYEEAYFLDHEVQIPGDADIFSEMSVDFSEILEKYDEFFFEYSYLVLIQVREDSDTVRHRIENVEVGEVRGEPKLCIDIQRLNPPIEGSADAYWYLFVEVDRGDLVVGSSHDIHVNMED